MDSTRTRSLSVGEVLGDRFEVIRPLFEGGMGCVYEGRQLGLDRKVALKTLQPLLSTDSDWLARFHRETQITQRLTHPNTVRVYDAGQTDDGVPYIAMELLEGRTLERVIEKKGELPAEMVTTVAEQVLGSLIEAHAAGIVHRDIKPGNLMLCKQIGKPNLVKVLDFGVAHLSEKEASFETQTGMVVGTPHYMSPEQARGDTVDERSDLYSLGIAIFEMATGSPPYNEGSPMEIAMQHLLPEPLEIPPGLRDTRLGAVIEKATRKKAEERFQGAREMLAVLTGQDIAEYTHFADSNPPPQPDDRSTLLEVDEKPTRVDVPKGTPEHAPAPESRRWYLVATIGLLTVGVSLVWFLLSTTGEVTEEPTHPIAALEEEQSEPIDGVSTEQVQAAFTRARMGVAAAQAAAERRPAPISEGTGSPDPVELERDGSARADSGGREQDRNEQLHTERPPQDRDSSPEQEPEVEQPTEDEPTEGVGMPVNF